MNWKGYGRVWSWPNLRYYPSIFLEVVRRILKNSSEDSRSAGQDLNLEPTKYEAEVLAVAWHSVVCFVGHSPHTESCDLWCPLYK
jgi:hypothetical protein